MYNDDDCGPLKGRFLRAELMVIGLGPRPRSHLPNIRITVSKPGLFFYPEDGGSSFLRNVASYLPDYTAEYLHCHGRENLKSHV
jgi:hypothetical protein